LLAPYIIYNRREEELTRRTEELTRRAEKPTRRAGDVIGEKKM